MERELLDKAMYGTPALGWEVERVRELDEQCATHDLEESCAIYNNLRERLGE